MGSALFIHHISIWVKIKWSAVWCASLFSTAQSCHWRQPYNPLKDASYKICLLIFDPSLMLGLFEKCFPDTGIRYVPLYVSLKYLVLTLMQQLSQFCRVRACLFLYSSMDVKLYEDKLHVHFCVPRTWLQVFSDTEQVFSEYLLSESTPLIQAGLPFLPHLLPFLVLHFSLQPQNV